MRFSERYGYKPVREIIQKESIDDNLKNALWNAYHQIILEQGKFSDSFYPSVKNYTLYPLFRSYWAHLFKKPIDEIPDTVLDTTNLIRDYFFKKLEWYEIYDFIEFTIKYLPNQLLQGRYKATFISFINNALERENSVYRIINDEITPITSEQEIQSIEEALAKTNPYSGVQQHLNQALKLMSDRQNPDYRNSIKESISSVESICKIVTKNDKASLGQALKLIEDKYGLHEALKKSLSQLYGYTSDGDGIRHAMLEKSNLTYIDAKFMLIACTNFINYLIDKTKDQN
ncbi:AbiJ-NTD4 domain-containing protein [Acinetobacter sp. YH12049]|uniref:AbiJ-NTD4 domain-containing protein n=1 Tax=Acinetobacter sp. YH12049 TaxID=2601054 RepID=UPI0015D332A4|nr:hypothetical protein [Acinetobacter sp. YH12049]